MSKTKRTPPCVRQGALSGAKGRADRPGLDALLKAVARREFDMVMAWSVDRLGRSLMDLLSTLQGAARQGR
jgi:DNA invertase Pin-like site-specific DNA recombinase